MSSSPASRTTGRLGVKRIRTESRVYGDCRYRLAEHEVFGVPVVDAHFTS